MLLLVPVSISCSDSKLSSAGYVPVASMLLDAWLRVERKLAMKLATSYHEWQEMANMSSTHWKNDDENTERATINSSGKLETLCFVS